MDEYSVFLNMSPVYVKQLHDQLQKISSLRNHILSLETSFEKYSFAGLEMCSSMQTLANAFTTYSEIDKDPTITSMSDLLLSFGDSMSKYFHEVQDHILIPLRNFNEKVISGIENDEEKAKISQENYIQLAEKYSINSKKKAGNEKEILSQLTTAYSDSIRTNFILSRNIELVNRKRLLELTSTVCIYSSYFYFIGIIQ